MHGYDRWVDKLKVRRQINESFKMGNIRIQKKGTILKLHP